MTCQSGELVKKGFQPHKNNMCGEVSYTFHTELCCTVKSTFNKTVLGRKFKECIFQTVPLQYVSFIVKTVKKRALGAVYG